MRISRTRIPIHESAAARNTPFASRVRPRVSSEPLRQMLALMEAGGRKVIVPIDEAVRRARARSAARVRALAGEEDTSLPAHRIGRVAVSRRGERGRY